MTNDLSQAYTDPAIAAKQRVLVNTQLAAMYSGRAPRHFAVVGELLLLLKEQSRLQAVTLLEVGCASAYYYEIINHYVPGWVEYTGADYNLGMTSMARNHYPGLPIYHTDVRDLDLFSARSYDIVLEGATLHHIRDWKRALGELARVARRWLILHRENLYWGDESTSCKVIEAYDNQVWSVRFNKAELFGMLAEWGFVSLSVRPSAGSPGPEAGQTMLFERKEQ